ncbi:MAG: hypothetical protein JST79_06545 [Acidobacteria bacterium]|nr:hypothetical protein [Acidobacteriota bacterium]
MARTIMETTRGPSTKIALSVVLSFACPLPGKSRTQIVPMVQYSNTCVLIVIRDLFYADRRKKRETPQESKSFHGWTQAVGVQQKLMRHPHVSTTMNVNGNALMESKREANSKIVQLVLGQEIGELDEEISDEIYAGHTSRLN